MVPTLFAVRLNGVIPAEAGIQVPAILDLWPLLRFAGNDEIAGFVE